MEDKQNHEQSLASTDIPAGGDKESNKPPEAGQTQGKAVKKKKRVRNKQRAQQASSDQIITQQNTSHQPSGKEKQCLKPQHMLTQTSCEQSTQTETPENTSQDQATQTLSLERIHTQPTESKSTQTKTGRLSYKQLYEGQVGEGQDCAPDQSRNPEQLTVLTWNIDGLDPEDDRERVPSLLLHLGKYRADVVLLQELVPPYLKILKEIMTDYEFLQGSDDGYFTGILLRRCRTELVQSNTVNYPTTEMGRNLLMAEVNFSGHQFCFMTSHLESLKASSQERLNQLRRVWKRMREAPDSQTVIFGGDTNMRDWEVKKLGGLPDGITDVWEMLGEPEDCKYTWDTVNNNNKGLPFPARLRFDRVYMRAAREGAQLRPDTMKLVGLKRLTCGRFTSDHWGILCTFSFESSAE
ncbi:tyrosyl-DNA phosphodiesterase 2 [Pangasianodon hypophthalmus]|uniref:tyrosyl-DNA phosphodiesterase 2 n=1 Tax=Pangasianodon hypophthalmus TaxID=310915 RepID=UPI0023080E90|nr:tyrosyl-DNA phosphodiesterase 2 [Pangasianodon hypophthalmus]XP_026769284.3 tyrosyl-DNA phosphodiesterase 2 [Pangasianodon hypophthalmus]